ncbi:MAG: heparinase II/III domain-containing protein [Planctomycetota bacterium]
MLRRPIPCPLILSMLLLTAAPATPAIGAVGKQASAFYPSGLVANARANAEQNAWAADAQKTIVKAAEPWMKLTDDDLWNLVFGHTIKRSWMVWSNGHCPACNTSVPMYTWEIAALDRPWKTHCPHCKEIFPKNDFHAFYRSGLDANGVFDPTQADRRLLFNAEHPEPDNPLYSFGVDDGEGYVDGDKRWRFIGAYLIYGQWKQAIVDGVHNLAAAYVVTGDTRYAHKAGILLDRVADLYPTFDFGKQGIVYERKGDRGYVSTWHDACREVRQLAIGYDQVFEALQTDKILVTFLADKARQYKLENPKRSFDHIQGNIEQRILVDTLNHRGKIESNYPQTDMAITMIKTVLGWPGNRDEVMGLIDAMMKTATAVDGVSGEKGLAGYTTIAPLSMAELLARYAQIDPNFLPDLYKRHPKLRDLFRFHIDTWCFDEYYPLSGDTGAFARKVQQYMGARFPTSPGLSPSLYTLFWQLYELTGDADFVRVMVHTNKQSVRGMPYDLLATDPTGFQKQVTDVIAKAGPTIQRNSVNKQQWCIAILRSGQGDNRRAVWLDYDAGGRHSHADGMNLGLFAKQLDLMPDFGYPPVQFGGWGSPRAKWYTMTAAHNTIVVDGQNQHGSTGKTTLWADGRKFHAIRASAPELIRGQQYERTIAAVDISDRDSYLLDVFRVVGGTDHAKFTTSHFGQITTKGLTLSPGQDFGHNTQMRNFRTDSNPPTGWHVDWDIEDRYQYLPPDADVHFRYTDLTRDASVSLAEAWITENLFNSSRETHVPRVMVRRRSEKAPLASTFVAVYEAYEKQSNIAQIRRLDLQTPNDQPYPQSNVAIEVHLTDGRRDLFIATDPENPLGLKPTAGPNTIAIEKQSSVQLKGELCLVRFDKTGSVIYVTLANGQTVSADNFTVELQAVRNFVEIQAQNDSIMVITGDPKNIQTITIKGKEILK